MLMARTATYRLTHVPLNKNQGGQRQSIRLLPKWYAVRISLSSLCSFACILRYNLHTGNDSHLPSLPNYCFTWTDHEMPFISKYHCFKSRGLSVLNFQKLRCALYSTSHDATSCKLTWPSSDARNCSASVFVVSVFQRVVSSIR